jgi:tRNA 2-thiouridine synthesizing protein A
MQDSTDPTPVHATLDVRGFNCPLPVLKTKLALRPLAAGEILRVLATDPMAVIDLRAFCARTGHALLSWSEGDELEFLIRKSDRSG